MKIGILTFHSQLNYGGVLQCWALQTALDKMGYEPVVIDRWLSEDNRALSGDYKKFSAMQWIRFIIRSLLGLGDWRIFPRIWRTKKFICQYLRLTPYHFVSWLDAPKELGVDLLIVGSDQVWHYGNGSDPRPYLLENASPVHAISYAASFGMISIPEELLSVYKAGVHKFKAISCRENEGLAICQEFGVKAEHVVDPTQLLSAGEWLEGLGIAKNGNRTRKILVCYFLSESFDGAMSQLVSFAKKERCLVRVFFGEGFVSPFPTNIMRFKQCLRAWGAKLSPYVDVCDCAGPHEFVEAFANADWVISDSFHALMFSLIFNCNARILSPKSDFRRQMFARIEELAAHVKGRLIATDLSSALESFSKGDAAVMDSKWLANRIAESRDWLKIAINQ